jgi:hypothetical protein
MALGRGSIELEGDARVRAAELYAIAGEHVMASVAYDRAAGWYAAASALVDAAAWATHPALKFRIELGRARALMMLGKHAEADAQLQAIAARELSFDEIGVTYAALGENHAMVLDRARAIEIGIAGLERLGIDLPAHPPPLRPLAAIRLDQRYLNRLTAVCGHEAQVRAWLDEIRATFPQINFSPPHRMTLWLLDGLFAAKDARLGVPGRRRDADRILETLRMLRRETRETHCDPAIALIEAQLARADGDLHRAAGLFGHAAREARSRELLPLVAYAHEERARMLEDAGYADEATVFYREAVVGYRRWMHLTKLAELEGARPTVRARDLGHDHVAQGLAIAGTDGRLVGERSAVLATWFPEGVPETLAGFFVDDPGSAAWFDLAWCQLIEGSMPIELGILQLPTQLRRPDRTLAFAWQPIISETGALDRMLVVLSDVTCALRRVEAEREQNPLMAGFEDLGEDRNGPCAATCARARWCSSCPTMAGGARGTRWRTRRGRRGCRPRPARI